ncbi:hypothetical protein ACIA8G_21475 [Lentzea sp. NPDC051213]|uniref:hypothetical protein n=1 Tax=Lentzea sp. NPDC051213 TaxID=3364126 RepID=UPI003789B2DA
MASKPGAGADPAEPIRLTSHRDLSERQAEVSRLLAARPQLARLMAVNPVLALREAGVHVAPRLAAHILHAIAHPPQIASRRDELARKLTKLLGEAPKPTEPPWLAAAVFTKLNVSPLDTTGQEPVFADPLNAETVQRLRANRRVLRPLRRGRRLNGGTVIGVDAWRPSYRRLDLAARTPELPPSAAIPKTLSLLELWFYKDHDGVLHDLLELGVIMKGVFPVHSADGFRAVAAGDRRSSLYMWITAIRFPELPR